MRRRQDEAFAHVVEAVILGILRKARREFVIWKVQEILDGGLVFGLVEPSRQRAADGRVLE